MAFMHVLNGKEALVRGNVILCFTVHVDKLQLVHFSDMQTTVLQFNFCICVVLY